MRVRLFDSGVRDRIGLLQAAASVGLDPRSFEACLTSSNAGEHLRRDLEDAVASEVQGTPTLFIGASKAMGALTHEDLECLDRLTERVE